MRLAILAVWVLLASAIGCSAGRTGSPPSPPPPVASSTAPPETPEQKLYGQVRSGHYQIDSALDPLETATKAAQSLADGENDPDTRKAIQKVAHQVSDAGAAVADYSEPPPSFDEFKKNLDSADDDRLKAIDACNRALGLLHQAEASLNDMLASGPPDAERKLLEKARDAGQTAVQTLLDAIAALGGKPA